MGPNNNIDSGGLGPFSLIFVNQFKWPPTIIPYNNIDPGRPGSSSLIFANQFKWPPI